MGKMTPPGEESIHETLTQEELDAKQAETDAILEEEALTRYRYNRRQEYLDKGWLDAFDLVDDVLERGIAAVKADRDDIRSRHPK